MGLEKLLTWEFRDHICILEGIAKFVLYSEVKKDKNIFLSGY